MVEHVDPLSPQDLASQVADEAQEFILGDGRKRFESVIAEFVEQAEAMPGSIGVFFTLHPGSQDVLRAYVRFNGSPSDEVLETMASAHINLLRNIELQPLVPTHVEGPQSNRVRLLGATTFSRQLAS